MSDTVNELVAPEPTLVGMKFDQGGDPRQRYQLVQTVERLSQFVRYLTWFGGPGNFQVRECQSGERVCGLLEQHEKAIEANEYFWMRVPQ